jgi:hypothetical protein
MILGLGNYLNGGTPRGQAYGVKLDFMAKLSTIKMNPIAKVRRKKRKRFYPHSNLTFI